MNDKPKCNARVSSAGDFRRHACGKTAAYSDEAGVPNTRCKTHSAEKRAATEAARNAKWQAQLAEHDHNRATKRLTDAVVVASFRWADGKPGGSDSLAEAVTLLRRHLGTEEG